MFSFRRYFFKKEKPTSEHKPYPKLITNQPPDTAGTLASFLEAKDLASVSTTCRDSHPLFSKARATKTLLQAVVFGDLKKAEDMIIKQPQLLLERGTVKDYSGRIHSNRTAFQLALGACDYNVKDAKGNIVVDGMIEMIEKHFKILPEKTPDEINIIMHSQYAGQFPEGYETEEVKRIADDSAALHRMINVIADLKDEHDCTAVSALEEKIHKIIRKEKSERADQLRKIVQSILSAESITLFEEAFQDFTTYVTAHKLIEKDAYNVDLLKALYQFRNYLEPKGSRTTGKHFNHQLLSIAAELYDKNYVRFGNDWDSPKNLFCWQKVFGGVERLVPACDAQSIAHGLWYLFEEGEKSPRSAVFRYGGGKYFPLFLDPDWEFGHNCAAVRWRAACAGAGRLRGFKSYVEQKQQCRHLSCSLDERNRRDAVR